MSTSNCSHMKLNTLRIANNLYGAVRLAFPGSTAIRCQPISFDRPHPFSYD